MGKGTTYKHRPVDPSRFHPVEYLPRGLPGQPPDEAWVDRERGWCLQVWYHSTPACHGHPWQGTWRIGVSHTKAQTRSEFLERDHGVPILWDDLQAIKDFFWADRIAVEVFPPKDKIVNAANMRWLWLLPVGATLPFNLQATQDTLTSGERRTKPA